MRILFAALAACLALLPTGTALADPPGAKPGIVRVRFDTAAGPFIVALDRRHAPKTVANFLHYVDDGRFDGTSFYRASRAPGDADRGFVQGGIGTDATRILDSVPLEPTSKTGLHHVNGALSMARNADPNSASGNFSILVGPNPSMDAHGSFKGYAVFGRVIAGMNHVRRMLALPTGGGSGEMAGQMILHPVKIIRAYRLDGKPEPTNAPRPWLLGIRRD